MGNTKVSNGGYYDPTVNADLIDETKQYKIYRNKNGQQFEKYRVKAKGSYDFENRYDYRIRNSSPYLVDAFSAKSSQNAFGCASGEEYEVVTERIPARLNDLNNLSGGEAVNMANKALKGFQQIYKSQGVLLVKDSMIGVNKENEIKVWMNSNFAVNEIEQPPISYGVLSDQEKESTMVDNIIELINSRAKRDPEWVAFVEEKYRQGSIGFDQAIRISQMEANRFHIPIYDLPAPGVQNRNTAEFTTTVEQKDHHYPQYEIPTPTQNPPTKTSTLSNSFNHEQASMMKNTTQTVASSTNPMNILASHSAFVPELGQPPVSSIVNTSSMKVGGQSQGISNLKNRIINGPPPQRGEAAYSFGNTAMVNTSFTSPPLPPPPLPPLPPLPQQQNNMRMNQMPVQPPQALTPSHQVRPPAPQFMPPQPKAVPSFQSPLPQSKPRAQSEGKPVVTFGNKVVSSSGANQFSVNARPLAPPSLPSPQTPQFQQVQNKFASIAPINQARPEVQPQPQPQPQPMQNFSQQNYQSFQMQNLPQRPQMSVNQSDKRNEQKAAEFKFQMIKGAVQENSVVYPPPNQVVNFERRMEAVQARNEAGPTVNKAVLVSQNEPVITENKEKSSEIKIDPKLEEKMQKSEHIMRQIETLEKSTAQKYNYTENPQIKVDPTPKTSQVQKSQTFGVITSIDPVITQKETVTKYQTAEKTNLIEVKTIDTPFFGREAKQNVRQELFTNHHDFNENHVDQYLAHEEQQLQILKKSQAEAPIVTEAKPKQSPPSVISERASEFSEKASTVKQKFEASATQVVKQAQNVTATENKNLSTSQKKPVEQKKKEVMKDETNFKKAVQETASNIRMEASKISIRSSSDLKGIISYRDLRDLLKTTRKPN